MSDLFTEVGAECGLDIRCLLTDGSKPVGAGIGPVEEARDILSVLECAMEAPQDLRYRALFLSAHLFDLNNDLGIEAGLDKAISILESGQALSQFNNILLAQGEQKELREAKYKHLEVATNDGTLRGVDNRKLARLAKLAGAPFSLNSGLRLHVNVGSNVVEGSRLFTLFSDSQGEMNYALDYYHNNTKMFQIED